jgi:hypothetical protein
MAAIGREGGLARVRNRNLKAAGTTGDVTRTPAE